MTDLRQPTLGQPALRGIAFALRDPFPWSVFAGLAREAEALGYSAVFVPEIAGRDALVALGALAGETERLLLGTGIVTMGARTTMLTAMGAATVHERSSGRILLGLGISKVLTLVQQWPTLVSTTSVVVAFVFSAAVGIFFGFYPARKASRLDPIEALRYE